MQAYAELGFPVTIIRPSLTYGPSQLPLAVNTWKHPYTIINRIRQGKPVIVLGDGTSLWVCTWNADFAVGLIGLFGNPDAIGEAFHITSDEVLTWNQIYFQVFAALGVKPNIIHIPSDLLAAWDDHFSGSLIGDKANSVVFDNSKIKQVSVRNSIVKLPGRRGLSVRLPGLTQTQKGGQSTLLQIKNGMK